MRRSSRHIDHVLLGVSFALILMGLFILASATFGVSETKFEKPYEFVQRQALGVLAGLVLMAIATRIPYRFWKIAALPLMLLGLAALLLVFIPKFGIAYGKGAVRWIHIAGVTFQPSEFIKVVFVMYLAAWLDAKHRNVESFTHGFLPFAFLTGIVGVFLFLQPNLSAFAIIAATALALFFIGGGRILQILIAIIGGSAILIGFMYLTGYNYERILVFMNPERDPSGSGYHITQSLIAIGSGGIFGKGFGLSAQKFKNLPEVAGDSIFSVFSEELGFVGNLVFLALFALFFWRAFSVAARAPDRFGKLLATGLTCTILFQVFVNVGALTGLLPLTGTPLPFVSYGRSAMITLLSSIGIILNISRYRRT